MLTDEIKALVVVNNGAWDLANPEYLSNSFLVTFRDLDGSDLTELPPGIFDSLTSLERLYVISLVG